jgi:hypothetical protein
MLHNGCQITKRENFKSPKTKTKKQQQKPKKKKKTQYFTCGKRPGFKGGFFNKRINFLKKKIHFVNVKIDPRLR